MPDSIEFFSSGSGRPLIMIHPLGLDHRTWDYCLGELSKYRTVMTYDLPGHGSSPHPDQSYSIEDLSKYLKASLKDLGIEDADFLGLSIGGMILQDFAAKNPDIINKLILVSTTNKYSQEWQANWTQRAAKAREGGLQDMIDQFLDAFFTKDYLEANNQVIDYCRATISKMNGESYAKACEALSACNLEDSTSLIKSETLILCGDQDNILFRDAAYWFERNIQNSKVKWLTDAKHLSVLEQQEKFLNEVISFLKAS